jgi:hypothetical protein
MSVGRGAILIAVAFIVGLILLQKTDKTPKVVRTTPTATPTTSPNILVPTTSTSLGGHAPSSVKVLVANGTNTPGNVEMTTTDQGTGGACAPAACAATQIRKVNVMLTGRSPNAVNKNLRVFRNSLQSQISLRGMAFVDEYRSTF